MYPEYALIGGKKYKINTDYKVALKCLQIVNDINISDTERALAVIYKLFGFVPDDNYEEFLDKARYFLQCGNEETQNSKNEPDMDLEYDRKFINASFFSDYHIDIENTKMHFWQYIELIEGFTEKTILSRVRHIRTCDVKDYAKKDRADIRRAKQQFALPKRKTKEEQAMEDEFDRLFGGG